MDMETRCYLILEDSDGLAVVQNAFSEGSRGAVHKEEGAILAEMSVNPNLADADGEARVWRLVIPGDGSRPYVDGYPGHYMDDLRARHITEGAE